MKNKFNVLIKNKISVAQNVQCSMFNVVVVGFGSFFLTLYEYNEVNKVKYGTGTVGSTTVLYILYPDIIIKNSTLFIDSEMKFA